MNKLLCVAALSSLFLTACATGPMASTNGATSTASVAGERYCFKRNLSEGDGKLHCNWVADRSQICASSPRHSESVEMARYTAPQPSGRCETGEYIVKVAPKA